MNGAAAKQLGLDLVSINNADFIESMRHLAKAISLQRGSVTADDLRQAALDHGVEPSHPNAWGAVFRGRNWEPVGYTQSRLPSNHARTIRIWRYRA